jgi:hypothetical protein
VVITPPSAAEPSSPNATPRVSRSGGTSAASPQADNTSRNGVIERVKYIWLPPG